MVILHILYKNGDEVDIYTVESMIERDVENARRNGEIEKWTVESL